MKKEKKGPMDYLFVFLGILLFALILTSFITFFLSMLPNAESLLKEIIEIFKSLDPNHYSSLENSVNQSNFK